MRTTPFAHVMIRSTRNLPRHSCGPMLCAREIASSASFDAVLYVSSLRTRVNMGRLYATRSVTEPMPEDVIGASRALVSKTPSHGMSLGPFRVGDVETTVSPMNLGGKPVTTACFTDRSDLRPKAILKPNATFQPSNPGGRGIRGTSIPQALAMHVTETAGPDWASAICDFARSRLHVSHVTSSGSVVRGRSGVSAPAGPVYSSTPSQPCEVHV